MRRMVRHSKDALHDLHDATAGPHVAPEAVVLGAFLKQGWELLALLTREFRSRAWRFLRSEGFGAVLAGSGEPLADGAFGDA